MAMAQYHGPPGTDIIDVAVSIGIDDPAAFRTADKERIGPHRTASADRAIDASRNKFLGTFKEAF